MTAPYLRQFVSPGATWWQPADFCDHSSVQKSLDLIMAVPRELCQRTLCAAASPGLGAQSSGNLSQRRFQCWQRARNSSTPMQCACMLCTGEFGCIPSGPRLVYCSAPAHRAQGPLTSEYNLGKCPTSLCHPRMTMCYGRAQRAHSHASGSSVTTCSIHVCRKAH